MKSKGQAVVRWRSRGVWVLAVLGILFWAGLEWALRVAGYGVPTSFFVPAEIQGREVWTDNQFFGYRFFPPRITRTPPCCVMDRVKQPGTIRVFVLGESAAMGDPLAEFGLARQLSCLLKARYPGKRFEVVNAAMTAISSHVIVEIAQEAARLQPDVFILYMGNNEVVGPYGPGTVFGAFSGSSMWTRARVWATRLRISNLLKSVAWEMGEYDGAAEWEGLNLFAERHLAEADERLVNVQSQFHDNIQQILSVAREAGAETILCSVAVNLRDFPPLAGEAARGLYERAESFLATENVAEANPLFERARDLDELRVRADCDINGTLRELGKAGLPGVRFVDAERFFQESNGGLVPGNEVFLDHVHFNFAGNYALALELAKVVAELPMLRQEPATGWLSLSECQNRLLYTVWSELDLTELSIQRLDKPPFNDQPDTPARIQALSRHREWLLQTIQSVNLDELRPVVREAMRVNPEDWNYPAGWGAILFNGSAVGVQEAEGVLRMALALAPHRYDHRAALSLVLGLLGRGEEGIRTISGNDAKVGWFPALYLARTGRLLGQHGNSRIAVEFLLEAIRLDPENVRAELDLATCFIRLGNRSEAEMTLRRILKRHPDQAEAFEGLALLEAYEKK